MRELVPAKVHVTVSPTSISTTFGLQRLSLPSVAAPSTAWTVWSAASAADGNASKAKAAAAAIRRFT